MIGTKVTTILLDGKILNVGGVASERVCACSLHCRLVLFSSPEVSTGVVTLSLLLAFVHDILLPLLILSVSEELLELILDELVFLLLLLWLLLL